MGFGVEGSKSTQRGSVMGIGQNWARLDHCQDHDTASLKMYDHDDIELFFFFFFNGNGS